MKTTLDPADFALLDGWQRGFPLVPRPFAEIAGGAGLGEAEVLARLQRMHDAGMITRIGATCRPNTAGASTLAAIAAPEARIEEVAGIVGAEQGVNHSYLRENAWNIWFVATGPDRQDVQGTLDRIRRASGLRVLDLPLVRPFNVDLGFGLDGSMRLPRQRGEADISAMVPGDKPVMQALSSGLAIVPRPFERLAEALGRTEADILGRIRALVDAGIISRIGVIVRHRALGWSSNAMVVWSVAEEAVAEAGPRLMEVPGVTLCYQRRPVPVLWPYTLYCMIHARSRSDALAVLARAREIPELQGVAHQVLFSLRCFKQRGALIDRSEVVAA